MKVREALNLAIRQAVKDGQLDRNKHAAIIEAARKVAKVMDDPEWPIVRGKIDNVSPSVFLKYCDALGLTVVNKPKEEKKGTVLTLVGNSKWKKASND